MLAAQELRTGACVSITAKNVSRIIDLVVPDRSLGCALKSRQCGDDFTTWSTRTRPTAATYDR
jgi:hypothetical protein